MASLFLRIREMMTAHAHHAIDEAENPQVMARQVLRDLAEDVQSAQRALVTALGAEKQLRRQQEQLLAEGAEWERKAETLLAGGKEDLARGSLDKAIGTRQRGEALSRPLATAQRASERMRTQLAQLKQEWETARHRCAEIDSQQVAANALGAARVAGDHYTRAMDRAQRLDRLSNRSAQLEAQTDAAAELLGEQDRFEREVSEVDRSAAVNEALAALKLRVATTQPAPGA